MSLLARLLLRFLFVAILCLAGTTTWIVHQAHGRLRAEAEASAVRVAIELGRQPGLGSAPAGQMLAAPDWRPSPTVLTILPGICVAIALQDEAPQRLCTGSDGLGETVPDWFQAAFDRLFDPSAPTTRSIDFRGRTMGTVTASPERAAASTRAWIQIRTTAGLAGAMAIAMGLLTALAAGPLLAPVGTIVAGLRALDHGGDARPLPRFAIGEFDRIAGAINAMADRLRTAHAERSALTLRLFQVQEDERRALARDLHDEFGQCLTATASLAESIALGAGAARPDLAGDARAIGRITERMMTTLKGALMRLQPPDLEEIGFEGSLRSLVASWTLHRRDAAQFRFAVSGDLATVPAQAALSLYRIAQELLTNAVRHGRPSRISLSVSRAETDGRPVTLVVDDDGGGDPRRLDTRSGRGLLGIAERTASLGGSLSIGPAAGGIRACAVIPTPA